MPHFGKQWIREKNFLEEFGEKNSSGDMIHFGGGVLRDILEGGEYLLKFKVIGFEKYGNRKGISVYLCHRDKPIDK